MESSMNHPNPLTSLLPLIILMVPLIFVTRKLAMEKGKDVTLYTVLACIPFVNLIIIWYIIGTPNKKLEEKMDRILEALNKSETK